MSGWLIYSCKLPLCSWFEGSFLRLVPLLGSRHSLARCSIVNFHGEVVYDKYIKQREPVTGRCLVYLRAFISLFCGFAVILLPEMLLQLVGTPGRNSALCFNTVSPSVLWRAYPLALASSCLVSLFHCFYSPTLDYRTHISGIRPWDVSSKNPNAIDFKQVGGVCHTVWLFCGDNQCLYGLAGFGSLYSLSHSYRFIPFWLCF